jgi:hypothetical protein
MPFSSVAFKIIVAMSKTLGCPKIFEIEVVIEVIDDLGFHGFLQFWDKPIHLVIVS